MTKVRSAQNITPPRIAKPVLQTGKALRADNHHVLLRESYQIHLSTTGTACSVRKIQLVFQTVMVACIVQRPWSGVKQKHVADA